MIGGFGVADLADPGMPPVVLNGDNAAPDHKRGKCVVAVLTGEALQFVKELVWDAEMDAA